jgi:hypothetical protein
VIGLNSGPDEQPRLLSGGNPQIPKGDGDAPVQAYIAAMPDWKQAIGRQVDALVNDLVPGVRKAVRWNSPFYGLEDQGWFLSVHCFTNYVRLTFLQGEKLQPPPPKDSKHATVRYLDIDEDYDFGDGQLAEWIDQASRIPGEPLF